MILVIWICLREATMCLSLGESAPHKWGEEAMPISTEIHGEIEASGKL